MTVRAIEAERLGKRYELGVGGRRYVTVREAIAGAARRGFRADRRSRPSVWALRDVSLEVDAGETVGVIGRNGAGKTTLLKVLARITDPTEGVARTRGRVGALLEVGVGFHPELTGRENIFLNGAVMGMSRRDTARRFERIVAFAEVERFIDTPLKRYSSGMYLRLAFAVAAHLEPAIVMVDEVLAVGDVEFRHKCLTRMNDLGSEGRTVLFVSHDLGAIARVCPRAIWIDRGRVKADGRSAEVINAYLSAAETTGTEMTFDPDATASVQPLSVSIVDKDGRSLEAPRRDDELFVRIVFEARERLPGLDVGFDLVGRHGGNVFVTALSDQHGELHLGNSGTYVATATIPPILAPGEYLVRLWIGTFTEDYFYEDSISFQVAPLPDDRQHWLGRDQVVQPSLDWKVVSSAGD